MSSPETWPSPDFGRTPLPVVPIEFRKGALALSYFSTVTTLGTPQDAMLQEIRLESFFPVDETTAAHHWEHHPEGTGNEGQRQIPHRTGEIPP